MEEEYICLECGHRWLSSIKPPRCGSGKGCSIIMPYQKYEKMIEDLSKIVNDNTPFRDRLNAMIELLTSNGIIKRRPLKLWLISAKLVNEAERRRFIASRGQL